eukprot:13339542-Heterocapsa_arctica.AAC.2
MQVEKRLKRDRDEAMKGSMRMKDNKLVSSSKVGGAYFHKQWTTPLTSEDVSCYRSAIAHVMRLFLERHGMTLDGKELARHVHDLMVSSIK